MTKKTSQAFRFEVSLEDRLKQRKEANNAVRLPRLGFKQYRVYDIESTVESILPITGVSPMVGPNALHIFSSGRSSGKSKILKNQLYGHIAKQWIVDTLTYRSSSKIRWMKPKHVTMLKLKGHRVEEPMTPRHIEYYLSKPKRKTIK
jgi:hypothetical protein